MKKIILSTVVSVVLATSTMANDCPTTEEKIAFGAISVAQGFIIGGPIGAFWSYGLLHYMTSYENPSSCNENVEVHNVVIKEPEVLPKIVVVETIKQELVVPKITKQTEEEKPYNPKDAIVRYDSFLNFDYDSSNIKTIPLILSTFENDTIKSIRIEGNTDMHGSSEYNVSLGLKRANSVKELLIKQKIDESKLSTISYGHVNTISNNDQDNRRVDLQITYKITH